MANKMENMPEGFHDLGEDIGMKGKEHIEKVEEEANTHIHYPSLWFHNKSELKDLPKEGVAEIMYRKVMEREEKVMVNGKEESRYTTELEICGIRPSDEGGNETAKEEKMEDTVSDSDAIDMGLEAAAKENK
jgi:hypothetical protein